MMLALLRGGAPNHEVLMAKRVEDLLAIAERHHISIPTWRSEYSDDRDDDDSDALAPAAAACDFGPVSGRGGKYKGQRNKYGEWEGWGQYTFTDGSVYEGQWRANQQDGIGTFCYALSGNQYHGQWKQGKKDGHGTFGYADGRVEVGTYKQDTDVGEGAMWSADRRTAWRILQDGLEVAEITLEEARSIAERVGEPVPAPGDWLAVRKAADAQANAPAAEEDDTWRGD